MDIFQTHFSVLVLILTIIVTFSLILSKSYHINFSKDQLGGPQKIHEVIIPRIGGVTIFIVMLFISILWKNNSFLFYLVLASIPIFLSGLLEDLTKNITASMRLFWTVISTIICIFLIGHDINSVGFELIDNVIADTYIPYIFAFLSIILLTQAFNIIDGLNGLCLLNAIMVIISIIYVSNKLETIFFSQLGNYVLYMLIGILIFNFPKPFIFMGDGGAYFLGFILSTILIIFSKENLVSPFFCLSIIIYPIYETLRSFFRRSFSLSGSFMKPDALHLHSLIYKYICSKNNFKNNWRINSLASVISAFLPTVICIWSCLHYNNRNFLIAGIIVFLFIFEILMYYLKRFDFKN